MPHEQPTTVRAPLSTNDSEAKNLENILRDVAESEGIDVAAERKDGIQAANAVKYDLAGPRLDEGILDAILNTETMDGTTQNLGSTAIGSKVVVQAETFTPDSTTTPGTLPPPSLN